MSQFGGSTGRSRGNASGMRGGFSSYSRRKPLNRARLLLPREDIAAGIGAVARLQTTIYDQSVVAGATGNIEKIRANLTIALMATPNLIGSAGRIVTYYLLQLPVAAAIPNVAIANAFTTTLRGIKLLGFRRVVLGPNDSSTAFQLRARTSNFLPTDRFLLLRDDLPAAVGSTQFTEFVSSRFLQVLPR